MNTTRRQTLLHGLFGAGALGLRALATGVPAWMLANPREAFAAYAAGMCDAGTKAKAQYLILSTSGGGDPLNANVPGTYDHDGIYHSADPLMEKTPIMVGGAASTAAKPWASLPPELLARTSFFHHTTLTNNHANEPKVLRLMGAVKRSEMAISVFAKHLSTCLGTLQSTPAVVSNNFITSAGRVLPVLSPSSLRDVLTEPTSALSKFSKLRDADLNRLNTLLKSTGDANQKAILDRMAQSQADANSLSAELLNALSAIKNDGPDGQIKAAIAMIRMNVAPVVVMNIPFGGDNHGDMALVKETAETVSGVGYIGQLYQELAAAGLQDRVSFAALNVFGRTLVANSSGGRDHLANHHCTVMFGKGIKGSVVGGLEPKGKDFTAQAIDSKTGRGGAGGDITFNDTLGALGKTLGVALGVPRELLDDQITSGVPVTAALA